MDPITIAVNIAFWSWVFCIFVGPILAQHRSRNSSETSAANIVGIVMVVISLIPVAPILIPMGLLLFGGIMLIEGLALGINKICDFFTRDYEKERRAAFDDARREQAWKEDVERQAKINLIKAQIEAEKQRAFILRHERYQVAEKLSKNHDLIFDKEFYFEYTKLSSKTPLKANDFLETEYCDRLARPAWEKYSAAYSIAMDDVVSKWKIRKLHGDKNSFMNRLPKDLLPMIVNYDMDNKPRETRISERGEFEKDLIEYWEGKGPRP